MRIVLKETDIKNIIEKLVNKIRRKNISDKSIILKMIDDELQNLKCEVIHEKDSYKNYGDASDYGYNSWIEFWQEHSPCGKFLNTIKICPCCGKPMNNPVGGHVQDAYGKEVFITPICHECNSSAANNEEFRKTPFKVSQKYLLKFNYNELRPLRHSK